MKTTSIAHIRCAIKALNGEPFTSLDLPKTKSMSSLLHKMVDRGEIIVVSPRFAQRKVYKEGTLLMHNPEAKFVDAHRSPWRDVWPEFFTPPAFTGESHVYGGME